MTYVGRCGCAMCEATRKRLENKYIVTYRPCEECKRLIPLYSFVVPKPIHCSTCKIKLNRLH